MNKYDCEDCKDKHYIKIKGSNNSKRCKCSHKKQILRYLTVKYNSKGIKFDISEEGLDNFIGKDIFSMTSKSQFQRFVKSFLLRTRMKYSHFTTTPHELVLAWVGSPEAEHSLLDTYKPDYLFLYLDSDPINSKYDDLICSVLKRRKMNGKNSWIYSTRNFNDKQFKELYGENLSAYLGEELFKGHGDKARKILKGNK